MKLVLSKRSKSTLGLSGVFWSAVMTLSMTCACSGPQTVEDHPGPPSFEEGHIPPETLVAVVGETARIQTFTADSETVVDLQLMVALGVDVPREPLLVEVRNLALDRRLGHGKISAFEAHPFVPTWQSVEWAERPVLERDESYALVFMTDAQDPDWQLAAARGTYAFGLFPYFDQASRDLDVGFRIQFTDATTQSKVASIEDPLEPSRLRRLFESDQPWGDRFYLPFDVRPNPNVGLTARMDRRRLPRCAGTRCVDATATLWGEPEGRADRARRATRSCGEAPVESLYFESGALGVSCRDVCRGHGFKECVGTQFLSKRCEARRSSRSYHTLNSCEAVVSASSRRDSASCLCSHEVLPREISSDAEVIQDRVRKNFELDERDRPILKPGRVATGLTCSQVCEVLGPQPCEGNGACPNEVTADFARCPPCVKLSKSEQAAEFRRTSTRFGDRLVTAYGGGARVVDPQSGTFKNYTPDPKIDLAGKTIYSVGRFAIWTDSSRASNLRHRYSKGQTAVFVALDTLSGEFHKLSLDVDSELECEPGAHAQSLEGRGSLALFCFADDETTIHSMTSDRRLKAPPTRGRHVVSWDDTSAAVRPSQHSGVQYSWSVGSAEWLSTKRDRVKHFMRSRRYAEKLKTLIASAPDLPNVIDGHYYAAYGASVWRFNAATEVFEASTFPDVRDWDSTVSGELIRLGPYVFDPEREVFKHVSATILHDVGRYGFIEATECPEQLLCRTLEAPLDDFAVLDLNVENYETPHTRELSKIEPR